MLLVPVKALQVTAQLRLVAEELLGCKGRAAWGDTEGHRQ